MSESTTEPSAEVAVDVVESAPIRVLHVDDEAGFLKVAKQCLEMQGKFEVETAVKLTERILDFASIYEKLGVEELTYIDVEKKP